MASVHAAVTATAHLTAATPGGCGQPVTHVPELAGLPWARCELPAGHDGLCQLTLRWEKPT